MPEKGSGAGSATGPAPKESRHHSTNSTTSVTAAADEIARPRAYVRQLSAGRPLLTAAGETMSCDASDLAVLRHAVRVGG